MKIRKNIPLIDQHDKFGFWGGKFGGNFIPETLKKPVEDLEILFKKLRKSKKFIKERDFYFKNWVGSPTPFIKLDNLTNHLGGAQIGARLGTRLKAEYLRGILAILVLTVCLKIFTDLTLTPSNVFSLDLL